FKEPVAYQESRIGVAVHKVLEMALGGMEVKMAFDYVLSTDGLTTQEMEDVHAFYEQVARFIKRMADFKLRHGVQHTFIEERWGLTHTFEPATFFNKTSFFRGVVDFAMLTKEGDLVIIDHKTGKEKELSYYEMQFCAYAVMGLAKFPKIRGVQTAINFTATDNLRWNKFISASQIRDELQPKLVKHIIDSTVGLDEEPKATKGWYCDWCGFKP